MLVYVIWHRSQTKAERSHCSLSRTRPYRDTGADIGTSGTVSFECEFEWQICLVVTELYGRMKQQFLTLLFKWMDTWILHSSRYVYITNIYMYMYMHVYITIEHGKIHCNEKMVHESVEGQWCQGADRTVVLNLCTNWR